MKRKACALYLSQAEYGVILDALIRFKNKLPRQGRYRQGRYIRKS